MNLKNNTTIKDFFKITSWTLKKTMSTSIAYWILLFITLPLAEIISLSSEYNEPIPTYYSAKYAIQSASDWFIKSEMPQILTGTFFTGVVIVFSTLFTFIVLHYMHGKRATDFFGSLPVTKTTMFFARVFSAAIASIVPMIATILLSILILCDVDAIQPFVTSMLSLIIFVLFNISFTSVICLCCGTTVDSIIKYVLINAIVPVTVYITNYFPAFVLPGMTGTLLEGHKLAYFSTLASPLIAPFISGSEADGMFGYAAKMFGYVATSKWWFYLAWGIAVIIFIALGRKIVMKRKAETAQSSVAFTWPDRVINFISNFAGGIVMGWIFAIIFQEEAQHIWFVFGCLLGSFVPHFLLHIIRNRSLNGFAKETRIYIASATLIFVMSGIVLTGVFGYVDRMPEKNDVKSVSVAYIGDYGEKNNIVSNMAENLNFKQLPTFDDNEMIDRVLDIHKLIIDAHPDDKLLTIKEHNELPSNCRSNCIYIRYNLSNGKTLERFYPLGSKYDEENNWSAYNDLIRKYTEIEKSTEYITKATGLHLYPDDAVVEIRLDKMYRTKTGSGKYYSDNNSGHPLTLRNDSTTGEQVKTILDMLRTETYGHVDLIKNEAKNYNEGLKELEHKTYYRIKVKYNKSITGGWQSYTEKYLFTKEEAPELAKIVAPLTALNIQ